MLFAVSLIFGLIVGSFLNVVTMRYSLGGKMFFTRTIQGRSHCPKCKTVLRWYELVPVLSFILQRAKCRHCPYKLSWQYPVVELVTGLLTALVVCSLHARFFTPALLGGMESAFALWCMVALWLLNTYTLITLSIIDLKYTIIPDASNILITIAALGVFALKNVAPDYFINNGSFVGAYIGLFAFDLSLIFSTALAIGASALLFGGIILLTRGRGMGLGDLKLIIPLSIALGWPDILFVMAFSFMIGAVVSVGLMLARRKGMKDGVPFGPFIALAVFVMMIYGERLLSWYFSLLSL